jgi:amidase
MTDPARLDAMGQADLVRRGEVTPRELVEAAIGRIEALDPTLNAVVTRRFEAARAEASQAARATRDGAGARFGPFAGVPFLLKDLGATLGGVRQTSGSRAFRDHVAPADSELVRRYRAAGLIILGKCNTPEFGNHSTTEPALFGPARNPWDLTRTTGGSSGGSAAAVASGMVPAAHGNDGAGSIRIPSSCCGLVGLKPSRGRNSWAPAPDPLAGLAVEHVLTRSVRDSAAFLDVTAGPAPGDSWVAPPPAGSFLAEAGADPGRLRIAFSTTPPLDVPVDPACRRAVEETVQLLGSLGHDLEEAAPALDGEVLIEPYVAIWAAANVQSWREATRELGRDLRPDELEVTTWELVEHGRRLEAAELLDAFDALATATREVAPFFQRYAAWVTPTLAQPPLPLGVLNASYGGAVEWWRFDCGFNPWNPIANMTGQPAISLPLTWTDGGLPVGTLLTGRYGDEATLIRLAAQLETARPWADRWPPVHAGQA